VQEAVSQDITSAQATFINDVLMPAAIAFFADVLLVVPVTGKIGRDYFCNSAYSGTDYTKCAMDASSSAGTCGSLVTVPDSHLTGTDQHGGTEYCTSCSTTGSCTGCTTYPNQGGGVSNADYVIYVTAQTAGPCPSTQGSGTLAYASKCQDDQYDRPTIGYVNFCPAQIQVADVGSSTYESQLSTAIHEITHALGFTSGNYAYWRDHANGGQPRTPRDSSGAPENTVSLFGGSAVALPATSTLFSAVERGNTIWKLATPKILEKAREQFGCSTLDGAEIENGGGSGTAGSHWEKRVFMNDFMSGVSTGLSAAYTPMTFALLEDTGWYYVNWASANIEKGTWLDNAGCAAVTDKCLTAGSDPPAVVSGGAGFFCNVNGEAGCTSDRSAGGYCSVSTYSELCLVLTSTFHQVLKAETLKYLIIVHTCCLTAT